MISVDTNVVLRLIVADDPVQTERAQALLQSDRVFIPITVVLETAWVLASSFALGRAEVVGALRAVLGLPGVVPERAAQVHAALALADDGLDIADALHLTASSECDKLASFDRQFVRRGALRGVSPPVVAP